MSLFDAGVFVLVYSLFVACIADLNLNDEQHELERRAQLENEFGSTKNFSHLYPNTYSATKIREGFYEVEDWIRDQTHLGQVSGICLDSKGLVYIFHRGDRVWGSQTFDNEHKLQTAERQRGPIKVFTILVYNPKTGESVQKWGKNIFYIPHGITVDQDDNVWVTDVGLHQVFKFKPLKSDPKTAELILGEAFIPGDGSAHFCKPTSVAVTPWGDFFVADGYCNSRILKFDEAGVHLTEWGRPATPHGIGELPNYSMVIPHALALALDKDLVCTADREDGRVLCFNVHNGKFAFKMIAGNIIGGRLFSVSYSPVEGGIFAVVNGPEQTLYSKKVGGFIFSAKTHRVIYKFGANLKNPHDVAISPDGKEIYVCELDPFKVRKYQSNQLFDTFLATNITAKAVKPLVPALHSKESHPPGSVLPAILVTAAALLFAGILLVAALIYSRARRRGRTLSEENLVMESRKLVSDGF